VKSADSNRISKMNKGGDIVFSSSKNNVVQSCNTQSTIGEGTAFNGNINSIGMVKVNGTLNGDIFTEAEVVIGEKANIKGNISAASISINGVVEGNVKCLGTLELMASARLTGDIEVFNLSVSKGAIFNGKCSIIRDEENFTLLQE
jgi:cytoskeletal protein CcmA (bactofilin family)